MLQPSFVLLMTVLVTFREYRPLMKMCVMCNGCTFKLLCHLCTQRNQLVKKKKKLSMWFYAPHYHWYMRMHKVVWHGSRGRLPCPPPGLSHHRLLARSCCCLEYPWRTQRWRLQEWPRPLPCQWIWWQHRHSSFHLSYNSQLLLSDAISSSRTATFTQCWCPVSIGSADAEMKTEIL